MNSNHICITYSKQVEAIIYFERNNEMIGRSINEAFFKLEERFKKICEVGQRIALFYYRKTEYNKACFGGVCDEGLVFILQGKRPDNLVPGQYVTPEEGNYVRVLVYWNELDEHYYSYFKE